MDRCLTLTTELLTVTLTMMGEEVHIVIRNEDTQGSFSATGGAEYLQTVFEAVVEELKHGY